MKPSSAAFTDDFGKLEISVAVTDGFDTLKVRW